MIGKLIILSIGLLALWAGVNRIGQRLGIGPFSPARKIKQKPKPFLRFAGFEITRFEALISGLFLLYLIWALAQFL